MWKKLGLTLAIATTGQALEVSPWFGNVYEFHLLTGFDYSWFDHVANSRPSFNQHFIERVYYADLEFCPSPDWSLDTDIQLADTTQMNFGFREWGFQFRYLWLDDLVGDPITLNTGARVNVVGTSALRDVSDPYHGNADFELNFALGKELEARDWWLWRLWAYGGVGHANRGSPWVRGIVSIETYIDEMHKFSIWAEGINGYGRRTHIDVDHFNGYAKVRQKSIDLGVRYGLRLGVWGTLRFEYIRRVLAKVCPEDVNTLGVSFLLPFSF